MQCTTCFRIELQPCEESWTIPLGLTPLTDYGFKITDKFGTRYLLYLTSDEDGGITISASSFPDGMFTQFSGEFTLQFESFPCESNDVFVICDSEYKCVTLSF